MYDPHSNEVCIDQVQCLWIPDQNIEHSLGETLKLNANCKTTIVIEHLIQASVVAHIMQRWQIFRKWIEHLFCEMHAAYKAGRAKKNPPDFLYKGEMEFFDFYVIPLANKLCECGVMGVYQANDASPRGIWGNKAKEGQLPTNSWYLVCTGIMRI